jgi:hypothetical protein
MACSVCLGIQIAPVEAGGDAGEYGTDAAVGGSHTIGASDRGRFFRRRAFSNATYLGSANSCEFPRNLTSATISLRNPSVPGQSVAGLA